MTEQEAKECIEYQERKLERMQHIADFVGLNENQKRILQNIVDKEKDVLDKMRNAYESGGFAVEAIMLFNSNKPEKVSDRIQVNEYGMQIIPLKEDEAELYQGAGDALVAFAGSSLGEQTMVEIIPLGEMLDCDGDTPQARVNCALERVQKWVESVKQDDCEPWFGMMSGYILCNPHPADGIQMAKIARILGDMAVELDSE